MQNQLEVTHNLLITRLINKHYTPKYKCDKEVQVPLWNSIMYVSNATALFKHSSQRAKTYKDHA